MKILISAATFKEIEPLITFLNAHQQDDYTFTSEYFHLKITLLITGVGSVVTVYRLTQLLAKTSFDLALNLGLCGAFPDTGIKLTDLVNITAEIFGDLGVKEGKIFKTVFDMGLADPSQPPFTDGKLVNPYRIPDLDLFINHDNITSITVNSVSAEKKEIHLRRRTFDAQVENMEGAAFFYVMLNNNIRFAEIRAVSNFIEKRDKEKWQILAAISRINEAARMLLMNIAKENFSI